MLSGLLIIIDILVCVALIAVVLLQRSEGGAFGMGGGPTGLITARGAGDLLTRTTWVLFGLFLALSLGLTLLGAHDRGASSVLEKLKMQTANVNALNQAPVNAPAPLSAPGPAGAQSPGTAPVNPLSGSFLAPPAAAPQQAPLAAPAPQPVPAAKTRAHAAVAPAAQPQAAPPILEPPPPKPLPAAPAAPAPSAPASSTP